MSRRIKPKEKYVRISMKEMWRNLDGPPKNKESWSYVVSFKFSRPKSSSCFTCTAHFVLFCSATKNNTDMHAHESVYAKRNYSQMHSVH